ncbi:MAG: uracil-DNA glycosylase [Chloroflexi bacterium]|nr:uracil-DNA glycosylase [Chloroflexota bacterium]MCL5108138.1 uracil-DNA glycosylase [Chloroflexota bacterium]
MESGDAKISLDQLAEEVRRCQRCGLGKARTRAVPGEGPANAEIVFIGEAPGYHEDRQGRPFVGPAGLLLEELLALIRLRRNDVYIANVIKCRPPMNRDPLPTEIAACQDYLDRQLLALRPLVIVTLGRFSMARYFPNQSISRIHGSPRRGESVVYYPVYHPAAALHQPSLKQALEADFRKLPVILEEARSAGKALPEVEIPPEQLRLL